MKKTGSDRGGHWRLPSYFRSFAVSLAVRQQQRRHFALLRGGSSRVNLHNVRRRSAPGSFRLTSVYDPDSRLSLVPGTLFDQALDACVAREGDERTITLPRSY